MRKLLLAGCAMLAFGAGAAFAQGPSRDAGDAAYTKTSSATSGGPGGSASANNGGTAKNVNVSKSNTETTNKTDNQTSNRTTTDSHNKTVNTTTTDTKTSSKSSVENTLSDCHCVMGDGSLSETKTITHTSTVLASAHNTGTVSGNQLRVSGSSYNGVAMTNSMNGMGIISAQQNTGTAALQQQSVSLGSIVGGNGGGLSGFSPTR